MKKKTLVLSSLLGAFALAVGAGAAAILSERVVETNAATGDKQSGLQLTGTAFDIGFVTTDNPSYQLVEQADGCFEWTGNFYNSTFRIITSGTWDGASLGWDDVDSTSAKVADNTFTAGANDNNILCNTAGLYTIRVNSAKTAISMLLPTVTSYNVTEYAVTDGVKADTAYATEKAYEGFGFVPTSVMKLSDNLAMQGWFTNESCTTAFTSGTVLTSATTLYAKYETAATKQTIWLSNSTFNGNVYAYSFGGNTQLGAWPGKKITDCTNGATFNGVGAIYKVELYSEYGDTKIIFNNNSGTQSGDLTITDGALYAATDATGAVGSTDSGSAAKVIYDINVARNAVAAKGDILAASICGISKATATTLVGEYDALTPAQKLLVDASTDYTYNYEDKTGDKVNSTYAAIVAQLRTISLATGGSSSIVITSGDSDASLVIAGIVVAAALTGGALAFVLSRKKKKVQ